MTIEGAIADLQNLIDNEGVPFWAKPSLQKIKETVEMEREQRIEERRAREWNRITKRPMDAEEREVWEVEMGEIADEDAYLYCNLPEDGEEVLVCTQSGRVFIDTMCKDEGCYFEDYGEMDGIVAWMSLPEPYYGLGQAFDPD